MIIHFVLLLWCHKKKCHLRWVNQKVNTRYSCSDRSNPHIQVHTVYNVTDLKYMKKPTCSLFLIVKRIINKDCIHMCSNLLKIHKIINDCKVYIKQEENIYYIMIIENTKAFT